MRRSLPFDKSWQSEELYEWVDGFLLGDGHIGLSIKGDSAHAQCTMQHEGWAGYAISGFKNYSPLEPRLSQRQTNGKTYSGYRCRTLTHPDLKVHRLRWYDEKGKKIIPKDLRMTPLVLKLWYIGDGSFSRGDLGIAAMDFTEKEVSELREKIADTFGLHFSAHLAYGKRLKLYLPAEEVHKFFDIIGRDDPTGCYAYKFDENIRNRHANSVSQTARNRGLPVSGFHYSVRNSQSVEEAVKLYRPRDGREHESKTLEEVSKILHVNYRRIPTLIEQAKIAPKRTRGGQWRFTIDEVKKMQPFVNNRGRCRYFPKNNTPFEF